MEQERYQQQYKAFVQQAEQRLNELCDVYLPVKAQISQAASTSTARTRLPPFKSE